MSTTGEVTLLGIRHHGPGSARGVQAALAQLRPDIVLVEGPPEADSLLRVVAGEGLRPPVALLAHVVDDPAQAGFWPYAVFSPEWVAMRHALGAGVPVQFIDLPAAHSFPLEAEERKRRAAEPAPEPLTEPPAEESEDSVEPNPPGNAGSSADPAELPQVWIDPIGAMAAAAGYDDAERWWDDAVEHRHAAGPTDEVADALAPFKAIAEAMGELRAETSGPAEHPRVVQDERREAYMRQRIRAARRAGHRNIAVVCGAWHVPALDPAKMPSVAQDRARLTNLPKVKVEVTWVPWTHRRLSRHSGYGAGIESPGWYHHLFTSQDRPVARWLTKVAGLLREEDYPVSSAHVIEAVRLAETLAVMRHRPLAGLGETIDAVRAVMGDGNDTALSLVQDRLIVGDALGEVPDEVPAVPLQRDLTRQQRSLRLKPQADPKDLELDLRKPLDNERSRLLHRLRVLGIEWGETVRGRESAGTFRESWRLLWTPELAIRVVEAGIWGTTVEEAATAKAEDAAVTAGSLAELTALAEACLLAGLPKALPTVMRVLSDKAALDADVAHLAEALPALVRALRYGDVRGTDASALGAVAENLAVRICVGLPPACFGLDADGARAMSHHLETVHGAIGLLDAETASGTPTAGTSAGAPNEPGIKERWLTALASLARREATTTGAPGVPGLLLGRATRLLLDEHRLDDAEAAKRMARALSAANPALEAASWVEGFLAGGGMLLVHDERLLGLIDAWLSGVSAERFTDVLPVLRRTFSDFEAGVRRTVGERVRRSTGAGAPPTAPTSGAPAGTDTASGRPGFAEQLDAERADAVLPLIHLLLSGVDER